MKRRGLGVVMGVVYRVRMIGNRLYRLERGEQVKMGIVGVVLGGVRAGLRCE